MNELKPCPFCGGELRISDDKSPPVIIACKKCDVRFGYFGTADMAIKALNRREPPHQDCFYFGGCGCGNHNLGVKPR